MSGSAAPAPTRLTWAVDLLDVAPDDEILEIGCGTGVAVDLVCGRLAGGHIHAIDRSAAMVARAAVHNARHIAAGSANIERAELSTAALKEGGFTKCFSVNVNLFWTRRAPELARLRDALARDGRMYLIYQPPSASAVARIVDAATSELRAHGFRTPDVVTAELPGGPAVCLRAIARGSATRRVHRTS